MLQKLFLTRRNVGYAPVAFYITACFCKCCNSAKLKNFLFHLLTDCPPEIPETKGNCTCKECYLADPNDCSAFYFCDHGILTKGYCPFGTLFSKATKICEDEDIVDCEANGDPSMCPELSGFFPYPGDCKKFIHCDNGVAHVQKCQTDLEYDPENRVCSKPKGYCGKF